MSTTFLAVTLTATGGTAEVVGFVKLSRELRRAQRLPVPASGYGENLSASGGAPRAAGMGFSAVIVNEVPPLGDTPESFQANVLARVENLEVLRDVTDNDRVAGETRVAGDIANTRRVAEAATEKAKALEEQARAERQRDIAADAAEDAARVWFIVGVVLATVGGVIGNFAT